MKNYATIQEWLKDNPDEKTIQKVLKIVNKKNQSQLKKELAKKQKELDKRKLELEALSNSIIELEKVISTQSDKK